MRLVSATKYADLYVRYERVVEKCDDAVKLAADRLSTITRLAALISDLRDGKPDGPLPQPKPTQGEVELRRQLALSEKARGALDAQLRELTRINDHLNQELRACAEGSAA